MTKVITLPMLCQIKREKMGLNINEAMARSKISNLRAIERGNQIPTQKTIDKLVSFYKITEEELEQCKNIPEKAKSRRKVYSFTLIHMLDALIESANNLDLPGHMGDEIKKHSLGQLNKAKEAINELSLLDRLIR